MHVRPLRISTVRIAQTRLVGSSRNRQTGQDLPGRITLGTQLLSVEESCDSRGRFGTLGRKRDVGQGLDRSKDRVIVAAHSYES